MDHHNLVMLLLGSNLGNRMAYLQQAKDTLAKLVGKVITASSVYESQPWGYANQPRYLNQALQLSTPLTALEILNKINHIESQLGRIRNRQWDARTLDIDILYYNKDVIDLPHLTVPHPHLQGRKFTLLPLAEIAPSYVHPILKVSNKDLLKACTDNGQVWKW